MIMVGYLGRVLALACSFVAPRTYAVVAFVRPWLWTAQSGRHLAIVDALLVARLAAQPLFGGSRRLGLDLVRLAVPARSQRHLRYEYHCHPAELAARGHLNARGQSFSAAIASPLLRARPVSTVTQG